MTRRIRTVIRTGLLLAVVVLLSVAHRPILTAMGRWLDVGERPVESEFVIALPGDEETRPFVAAALVNTEFAERVLLLPSHASPDEEDGLVPPTTEITRRVYAHRGIPASKMVQLEGTSRSTFHDASIVRDYVLRAGPKARLIVVTNDYHSRRARWIFRRVFDTDAHRLTFVSAPMDGVDPTNWWNTPDGLREYVAEFIKLPAYWLVYGDIVAWASVVVVISMLVAWRRRKPLRTRRARRS